MFRQLGIQNGTNNVAGVEWMANNTQDISTTNAGDTTLGAQLDEDHGTFAIQGADDPGHVRLAEIR
jgi:hypothetical protein